MSNTNVTVTVQDPTGQAWADGSISYRIAGTKPVFFNGVPLADIWFTKQTVKLDGNGSAAFALPDNSQMTPFGQMWQLTVNPNAYTTGVTVYIAITGATMDISAVINNAIQQPAVIPLTVPFAYADGNIILQNGVGELYYNTGAEIGLRVFTGLAWRQVDSGGGGGGSPAGPLGAVQFNNGGTFGGDANLVYTSPNLFLGGKITSPALATFGGLSTKAIIFPTATVPTLNIGTDTAITAIQVDTSGNTTINKNLTIDGSAIIFGGLTTYDLAVVQNDFAGITTQSQGTQIAWNISNGGGETDFINSRGSAGGGFRWYNAPVNTLINAAVIPILEIDGTDNFWFRPQSGAIEALHIDRNGNAVFAGNVYGLGFQMSGEGLDIQTPGEHFKIWDDGGSSYIDAAHNRLLINNNLSSGALVQIHGLLVTDSNVLFSPYRGFAPPTLNDVTGSAPLNTPKQNSDPNNRAVNISGWFLTNSSGSNVGTSQIALSSDGVNFTTVWDFENTSAVANSHIGFSYGPIPFGWWYRLTGTANISGIGKVFELAF